MTDLQEAFKFKNGGVVQMLVEPSGQDPDDNELTLPVGAIAIIDPSSGSRDFKGSR